MGTGNVKTILFFAIALIVVGVSCVTWLPASFPLGKSFETWLEHRVVFFQELQQSQTALRDLEMAHNAYMSKGDPQSLDAFQFAATSAERHVNVLNSISEPLYGGERLRSLSTRVNLLLQELRQSVELRQKQGKAPTDPSTKSSSENREIRDIVQQISRMEEDEFEAVKNRASDYNKIIGPYPWMVIIGMLSFVSVVILFAVQGRNKGTAEAETIKNLTTELDSTRQHLEVLSRMDMLTGALNITGLERVMQIEENKITRAGGHMIAILVNCDNFKKIYDGLGMATSDVVLKDLAKRIVATLRPSDHVARIGGDEFIVLLPDTQLAYGLRVAERIRIAVADTPLHSFTEVPQLTVSLGVAMLPHKVSTVKEVVALTRGALKRSKQAGKNKVTLAREGGGDNEVPETNDELVQRLLDISNFRTVFQPIVDLATEQVAGFEIFTRGPDGAFENPGDLFRVCIENNMLTTVDLQCLKLCLEMAADITDNMRVHVNLFPSTILDTPIETLLQVFPQDRGGKVFCVEISEQQFVGDPTNMREHVQKLRQAGILVAIDDIGFGRSSLETLIFLEPDVVKVDRTYVTGVSDDKYKVRLLKRLTNVAKSLGAEVVAEGVERREDLPVLQDLGIHFAQGFLWGELLQVLPASAKEQRTILK